MGEDGPRGRRRDFCQHATRQLSRSLVAPTAAGLADNCSTGRKSSDGDTDSRWRQRASESRTDSNAVKSFWIILIVLLAAAPLRGQYYGSTDYSIERWT